MSNYDWNDDWTPYDKDYSACAGGKKHCGSVKEHEGHRFSVTPYDPQWRRRRPGPYYDCPGTPARAERFMDMVIHFHDNGHVTWSKPNNVYLAVELNRKRREDAAHVAFPKEA